MSCQISVVKVNSMKVVESHVAVETTDLARTLRGIAIREPECAILIAPSGYIWVDGGRSPRLEKGDG